MKAHVRTKDHRTKIPLSSLIEAYRVALAEALGLPSDTRFQHDHDPALCLRDFDPETGRFTPDQNDPAFIKIMTAPDHAEKTFGTKATTAGSDVHLRAKNIRLTADQEEFQRRMLAKEPGKPRERTGKIKGRSSWPKRSFRSSRPC